MWLNWQVGFWRINWLYKTQSFLFCSWWWEGADHKKPRCPSSPSNSNVQTVFSHYKATNLENNLRGRWEECALSALILGKSFYLSSHGLCTFQINSHQRIQVPKYQIIHHNPKFRTWMIKTTNVTLTVFSGKCTTVNAFKEERIY